MKNFTLSIILSFLSLISFAQDATFNWVEHEVSPDNNLQKMVISGSEAVIAGYGNTLIKSTDNGENWSTKNFFDPLFSFAGLSIEGSTGLAVAGREKLYDAGTDIYAEGIILKTQDGGITWTNVDLSGLGEGTDAGTNPNDTLCYGKDFQAVKVVNDSVAYCALRWYEYGGDDHSGIFKTIDSCKTWTNISGDMEGDVVTSIESIGETVYIGGNKLLYKTTISDNTLTDIFSSLPGDGTDYISSIYIVNENEFYLPTTADSIYYTFDGGTTLAKFPELKGGWDIKKVNDSTLVVGGSSNKSYVSTNSGQTWNALGITTSIWEVPAIFNDTIYFLAKADIYKISVEDILAGNYNFTTQTISEANLQKAIFSDELSILAGNDKVFKKSTDGGKTWSDIDFPEIAPLDALVDEIDFSGLSNVGQEGYACFNRIKFVDYPDDSDKNDIFWSGGVLHTTDNWETAEFLDLKELGASDPDDTSKNPNHDDCEGVNTSFIKFLGNDEVLLWTRWYDYSGTEKVEHSRVFKSDDIGDTWTVFSDDLGTNYLQDIAFSGDTIYMCGKNFLLKSVDAGANFTDIYPNLDEGEDDAMYINSITLDGPDNVYLTTTQDSVHMSTDGGNTFSVFGTVSGTNDFYKFDNTSYILLGGSGKSIFTNDTGENWTDCYTGATIYEIGGVYGNKLYALARGSFYTQDIDDLQLTTSSPLITNANDFSVEYHSDYISVVSSTETIEKCYVYSITGALVSIETPNSTVCNLNRYDYKSGIYIISAISAKGEKFVDKIVFK